jgi:hypothetical protein
MLMQVQWEVLKSQEFTCMILNIDQLFDYAIDGTAGTNSKTGK